MRCITSVARSWIGTPYQHQASLRGVGCDCVGLVRGVWRELYGAEPWLMPAYSPDWAEVGREEQLLAGLAAHFTPVEVALPGDVVVFRMKPGAVAKHVAILSAGDGVNDPQAKIIHAYWGHAVVESWLGPFWRKCVVGVFRWPEKQETPHPSPLPSGGERGQ